MAEVTIKDPLHSRKAKADAFTARISLVGYVDLAPSGTWYRHNKCYLCTQEHIVYLEDPKLKRPTVVYTANKLQCSKGQYADVFGGFGAAW